MAGNVEGTIGIGRLSELTGVSVRALRYYEQRGLLPAERTGGGNRRFPPESAETVRRIRLFLDAGMPIAVVVQVISCFVEGGAALDACVAASLREHRDAVLAQIGELAGQHDAIDRLQSLVLV